MNKEKKKKFKVHLTRQVKGFISKLPKEEQDKMLDLMNSLAKNPLQGKKIKGTPFRCIDI